MVAGGGATRAHLCCPLHRDASQPSPHIVPLKDNLTEKAAGLSQGWKTMRLKNYNFFFPSSLSLLFWHESHQHVRSHLGLPGIGIVGCSISQESRGRCGSTSTTASGITQPNAGLPALLRHRCSCACVRCDAQEQLFCSASLESGGCCCHRCGAAVLGQSSTGSTGCTWGGAWTLSANAK